MCVYVCVYVCMCVCMQCTYRGPANLWNTTFSCMYMYRLCMCFNSSSFIMESLQKEAIRSKAVKILMTNTSLVNVMSNTTQM